MLRAVTAASMAPDAPMVCPISDLVELIRGARPKTRSIRPIRIVVLHRSGSVGIDIIDSSGSMAASASALAEHPLPGTPSRFHGHARECIEGGGKGGDFGVGIRAAPEGRLLFLKQEHRAAALRKEESRPRRIEGPVCGRGIIAPPHQGSGCIESPKGAPEIVAKESAPPAIAESHSPEARRDTRGRWRCVPPRRPLSSRGYAR